MRLNNVLLLKNDMPSLEMVDVTSTKISFTLIMDFLNALSMLINAY